MNRSTQNGSAIIMLLIAVALFAMVTYAFLQGSRGNIGMMTSEAAKVAGYTSQDCTNSFNMGMKRLKARSCEGFISMSLDGSNSNSGAPSDGSCSLYHPNGGGAKPCNNPTTPVAVCTVPGTGDVCPDGTVYAGLSPDGNTRMYTTPTNAGGMTWNDGSTNFIPALGAFCWQQASYCVHGQQNTLELVALSGSGSPAPYVAAEYCHNLVALGKDDWYLPSRDEVLVMCANQNDGALNGTWDMYYWSSSEDIDGAGSYIAMGDCSAGSGTKTFTNTVRCVRKD